MKIVLKLIICGIIALYLAIRCLIYATKKKNTEDERLRFEYESKENFYKTGLVFFGFGYIFSELIKFL